jgi:hypothetical protein
MCRETPEQAGRVFLSSAPFRLPAASFLWASQRASSNCKVSRAEAPPKFPIFAESETLFFFKIVEATL